MKGEAVLERLMGRVAYKVVAVVAFSLLVALAAKVRIPLPWTPVPITLQVLPVLLSGALMGPGLGAASMGLYLLLGLLGLPVFAEGGSGPAYFLGATGGYLLGFVAGSSIVPWVRDLVRPLIRSRPAGTMAGCIAGIVVIYALGCLWLWWWHLGRGEAVGLLEVLAEGALPFIGVDMLKAMVVVGLDSVAVWAMGRGERAGF